MGGNFLASPKGGEQSPPKYYEVFEEHLPFYLHIGMTEGQYWNGDPQLVKTYRKKHELQREQTNQEMWLQGLYIYEALLDVSPVFHDFVKHPKPMPYPSEPYPLTTQSIESKKAKEEKARMEKQRAIAEAWAKRVNDKLKEKQNG